MTEQNTSIYPKVDKLDKPKEVLPELNLQDCAITKHAKYPTYNYVEHVRLTEIYGTHGRMQ